MVLFFTHRALKDPSGLGLEKAINVTVYVYIYGGVLCVATALLVDVCILLVLFGFQPCPVTGMVRPFYFGLSPTLSFYLLVVLFSIVYSSLCLFSFFNVSVDAQTTWFALT